MENLRDAISKAVWEYGFDQAEACQVLLDMIQAERNFISEIEKSCPQTAIERKLKLSNLEILCAALMELSP